MSAPIPRRAWFAALIGWFAAALMAAVVKCFCATTRLRLAMISPKPNTPMAMATKPMPSVISGVPRFSFDIPELTDGIGFVAIAMGVFGFGEIISNLGKPAERLTPREAIWLAGRLPSAVSGREAPGSLE